MNRADIMAVPEDTLDRLYAGKATEGDQLLARNAIIALTEVLPPAGGFVVDGWPFVESPGDFTERLQSAMHRFPLIGAVRHVLIEDPPTIIAAPTAQPSAKDGVRVPADKCSPHVWGPWHVVVRQCYVCRTEECGPSRPTTATGLVDGGISIDELVAKWSEDPEFAKAMDAARARRAAIGREVTR